MVLQMLVLSYNSLTHCLGPFKFNVSSVDNQERLEVASIILEMKEDSS